MLLAGNPGLICPRHAGLHPCDPLAAQLAPPARLPCAVAHRRRIPTVVQLATYQVLLMLLLLSQASIPLLLRCGASAF